MLKDLTKIKGIVLIDNKSQKMLNGGEGNCRLCYLNNGGAYNVNDPNCWGCPLPEPQF